MLLGLWKNIEELESSVNLDELQALIEASREKIRQHQIFLAAIEGIKIDDEIDAKDKVEEMKQRAEALRQGKTEDEFEFDTLGIEIEVEDTQEN